MGIGIIIGILLASIFFFAGRKYSNVVEKPLFNKEATIIKKESIIDEFINEN